MSSAYVSKIGVVLEKDPIPCAFAILGLVLGILFSAGILLGFVPVPSEDRYNAWNHVYIVLGTPMILATLGLVFKLKFR